MPFADDRTIYILCQNYTTAPTPNAATVLDFSVWGICGKRYVLILIHLTKSCRSFSALIALKCTYVRYAL